MTWLESNLGNYGPLVHDLDKTFGYGCYFKEFIQVEDSKQ